MDNKDGVCSSLTKSTPIHANKLVVVEGSLTHLLGKPFHIFTKYVKVFDLYFVATSTCPDYKVLHGATVLYQYIDNDDDGVPDNQAIYAALVSKQATMISFCDKVELKIHKNFFRENKECKNIMTQDLEADETRPGSLLPHKFDESLEECFHLVSQGYAIVYPEIFSFSPGSLLTNALDHARGGHFEKVPKKYPKDAWFTYYHKDCCYSCMATEYMYWAMTSILGAQEKRKKEVGHEWRLCTRADVEKYDNAIYKLLTDRLYKFPTTLPVPADQVPVYDESSSCNCNDGTTCKSVRSIIKRCIAKHN